MNRILVLVAILVITVSLTVLVAVKEGYVIGLSPKDAQQSCYDIMRRRLSTSSTGTAASMDQNTRREYVLKNGLKPALTRLAGVEAGTMQLGDSDGVCVMTPDIMTPYGVDTNDCVLRDKKTGASYPLSKARFEGLTPDGCLVDFRKPGWENIIDTMYANEHSAMNAAISTAHNDLVKTTAQEESAKKAAEKASIERLQAETTLQTNITRSEALTAQLAAVQQNISAQLAGLGGLVKIARYVILERIDGRNLAISVREIEVYDVTGKRIPIEKTVGNVAPQSNSRNIEVANGRFLVDGTDRVASTGAARNATMTVDLKDDVDVSKVIIKNRFDLQDSIIGTRLSVKTSGGETLYSQDIRTAQNEYIFNMISGASNAITIMRQLLSSANSPPVDGVYNIVCNGVDRPTYCIMNRDYDGGGWMLLMKMKHGDTFNFRSNHWTTPTELNALDTNLSMDNDAKFPVFNHVGIKDIMVIFMVANRVGGHMSPAQQTTEGAKGWVWRCTDWYGGKPTTGITGFGESRVLKDTSGTDMSAHKFDPAGIDNRVWSSQSYGKVVFGGHTVLQQPSGRGWQSANDWGTVRFGMVFNENGVEDFMSNDAWCGIGGGFSDGGTNVARDHGWGPAGNFSAGDYYGCCGTPGMNSPIRALVFGR
jgi:hypothetical protein